MLVSDVWFSKWPLATIELFKGGTSDHLAQITRLREIGGRMYLFRAFNSWWKKEEVKELAREAWNLEVTDNLLYKVVMKLKNIKI